MTDREKFEAWLKSTGQNPAYATKRGYWEIWQAALASQQPADDGWVEWKGGEFPLPKDRAVEFQLRSGSRGEGVAENYWWHHEGGDYDIIAYRVVKP